MTPWLSPWRTLVFGFLLAGLALAEEHQSGWDARFGDGITAIRAGNYDQAVRLLESVSDEAKSFPPGDTRRTESILALAVSYQSRGRVDEAELLYLEAKQILESRGQTNSLLALALDHLGQLRLEQGRWRESEPFLERARELYMKTRDPRDPRIVNATRFLGEAYLGEGRLVEAEPFLLKAVEGLRNRPDIAAASLAAAVLSLATLYTVEGRYQLAQPLLEESLQLNGEPGSTQPELADSMLALGNLYLLEGDTARATPLLQKAVRIFDATGDSRLPNGLSALGAAALQEGKYAVAKDYLERALDIGQKLFSWDHLAIALAEGELAEAYLGERNLSEAAVLIQQAIAIERSSLGDSHFMIAKFLLIAAHVEACQHRRPQAEAHYREALEIYRRALRPDHPDLMNARKQYAQFSKGFRK